MSELNNNNTTEQPVEEKKNNKKPLIIGGILGGVAVIAIGAIVLSTTGGGGGIITPSIKPYTTAVINGKEYNNDKTIAIVNGVEVQSYEKLAELTDANKNPYVCVVKNIHITVDKKYQEALDYLIDTPVEERMNKEYEYNTPVVVSHLEGVPKEYIIPDTEDYINKERERLINDKSLVLPESYKLPVLYWSDTKDVPKEYITKKGFQAIEEIRQEFYESDYDKRDNTLDEVKIKVQGSFPATYTYICGMFGFGINNGSEYLWGSDGENPINSTVQFSSGLKFNKWVEIVHLPSISLPVRYAFYRCFYGAMGSFIWGQYQTLGAELPADRMKEYIDNLLIPSCPQSTSQLEVAAQEKVIKDFMEWATSPAGTPIVIPAEVYDELKNLVSVGNYIPFVVDKQNNITIAREVVAENFIPVDNTFTTTITKLSDGSLKIDEVSKDGKTTRSTIAKITEKTN